MIGPATPERKHPLIPIFEREPIDEPFLPEDPGDEPENELRAFQKRHLGEYVHVRYISPRGPRNAQGVLRFGFSKINLQTERRIYRIRYRNVLKIDGEGESWSHPN